MSDTFYVSSLFQAKSINFFRPIEVGEEATEPIPVSECIKADVERDKILELIKDIGTDSESMIAKCDKFKPYFFVESPHKVMTV